MQNCLQKSHLQTAVYLQTSANVVTSNLLPDRFDGVQPPLQHWHTHEQYAVQHDAVISNKKLERMRWFSHQRRTAPDKTACKQAAVNVHCCHPSPPTATQCTRLLLHAAYGLQCTCRLTMHCQWEWLSIFSFFLCRWPWPLTLTLELKQNFCTMHLGGKFHHLTFNRLAVIVRTNKQTDRQTDVAENIHLASLRYAGG